jgi:MFS transporter, Spinster family, sphingosine-1-phosphate transporter
MAVANSTSGPDQPVPGAHTAMALLFCINLFNYIDRQVLSAVLPRMRFDRTLFDPLDPNLQLKLGVLTSAFLVSYMLISPLVGWLDGRGFRRWIILGAGVSLWSLASGSCGLVQGYTLLLLLRCCVGVGEGAYGPVASALLADAYPLRQRGGIMALFNLAIPVGSALGFLLGGMIADYYGHWRPAFLMTFLGLGLGLLCLLKKELPRQQSFADAPSYREVLRSLQRNRSFIACCIGMTAITFVIGGVAAWAPVYIFNREARFQFSPATFDKLANKENKADRVTVPPEMREKFNTLDATKEWTEAELREQVKSILPATEFSIYYETILDSTTTPNSMTSGKISFYFGVILAAGGLVSTLAGSWLGEWARKRFRGGYFLVIALGVFLSIPCYLLFLTSPLPIGWVYLSLAIFGLFLHTGPAFTLLANVVTSPMRATAFALNILVIHALGDVISPPLIGWISDRADLQLAFLLLAIPMFFGGVVWLVGTRFLDADTARAERSR